MFFVFNASAQEIEFVDAEEGSCFDEAWEYGNTHGTTDYGRWYYMDWYYRNNCE